MMENLVSQAEVWGFLVESNRNGNWQVLPQQPTENWKLQQTEDRWLLIIGNVPQVKLHPNEAISFFKSPFTKTKESVAVCLVRQFRQNEKKLNFSVLLGYKLFFI